eukprot:scaffold53_cov193-Pinguiococcus_pyrenoidosus.AAC.6
MIPVLVLMFMLVFMFMLMLRFMFMLMFVLVLVLVLTLMVVAVRMPVPMTMPMAMTMPVSMAVTMPMSMLHSRRTMVMAMCAVGVSVAVAENGHDREVDHQADGRQDEHQTAVHRLACSLEPRDDAAHRFHHQIAREQPDADRARQGGQHFRSRQAVREGPGARLLAVVDPDKTHGERRDLQQVVSAQFVGKRLRKSAANTHSRRSKDAPHR